MSETASHPVLYGSMGGYSSPGRLLDEPVVADDSASVAMLSLFADVSNYVGADIGNILAGKVHNSSC